MAIPKLSSQEEQKILDRCPSPPAYIEEHTTFHIKMRREGSDEWWEKDLPEYNILLMIRTFFKEKRNKEIGYFWYDLYSRVTETDKVKKNLAMMGLTIEDFKKYKEQTEEKRMLSSITDKAGKNGHKH